MSRPVLTIVAGSDGCGKSTLTAYGRDKTQGVPVLDPDAVARSLQSSLQHVGSDIEAGKQVLLQAEELLALRESFTVETTLSGGTYLRMAERARSAGYLIVSVFVGTTSVEINLERVRARVEKGGHDVPEQDQRRRYPRTLANMAKLLPMSDLVILMDNSTAAGHRLVCFGAGGIVHRIEPVPAWALSVLGD